MTPAAVTAALLGRLTDWAIGPRCPLCGDRRRGPRTLAAHLYVDHGDVAP